jgi:hypothetical protein
MPGRALGPALALGLACAASLGHAQNGADEPSIDRFLTDANALVARGQDAIMSPEADALRNQMRAAATAARTLVAAHDGKPAAACPPPPGQGAMTLGDVLDTLERLPPEARSQPLSTGLAALFRQKFPCH